MDQDEMVGSGSDATDATTAAAAANEQASGAGAGTGTGEPNGAGSGAAGGQQGDGSGAAIGEGDGSGAGAGAGNDGGSGDDGGGWADFAKQIGFSTVAEMQQALQELEVEQANADIDARWQERVENGEIDEETARERADFEKEKRTLDAEKRQVAQFRLENQITDAKAKYPEMDEETVRELASRPGADVMALAQKSHQKQVQFKERIVSEYVTDKAKDGDIVVPEGGGQQPGGIQGGKGASASWKDSWANLFGLGKAEV